MINFIIGPQCSGIGLVESILKRSMNIIVNDIFDGDDFVFDASGSSVYISIDKFNIIDKYMDRSLIVFRCPITSLLCIFEKNYNRLGRDLTNDEIYYYSRMFIQKMIYINSSIEKGCRYFLLKDDDRLLKRLNDLCFMVCGENLAVKSDIELFYESSFRNRYEDLSCLSRKNRLEVNRIGTLYTKYGIDLEI